MQSDRDYDPDDKYTWREGDIVIVREGTGEPLLSQEELDRILRENPAREAPSDGTTHFVIVRDGTSGPPLNQEELDRILRENPPPAKH